MGNMLERPVSQQQASQIQEKTEVFLLMAEELENVAPPVFVSGIELLRTFFARSAKIFFLPKRKKLGVEF